HRTPCWVRWPAGQLGEPRDVDSPAEVQDVLPTLLELSGVPRPANAVFDGVSLAGLVRGQVLTLKPRTFVVQYSRAQLTKYECAVVRERWRLVHGKELYDVHADRAQAKDVSAQHPDVAASLKDHYEKWWASLGDRINDFVPTTLGSPQQPLTTLTSS